MDTKSHPSNDKHEGYLTRTHQILDGYAQDVQDYLAHPASSPDERCTHLNEQVYLLIEQLADTPVYRHTLKQIRGQILGPSRWYKSGLATTASVEAGFIQLARDTTIPFHDHPGTLGALLVMEGSIEVRTYEKRQDVATLGKQAAFLKPVDFMRLGTGDTAILLPDHANIYGLRCIESPCFALELHVNLSTPLEKSWYFPLGASSNDTGTIMAAKVPEELLRSALAYWE
jgi:hypothetical protein